MAKKETTKKKTTRQPVTAGKKENYEHLLLQPRVTEKATMLAERNVYTFDVAPTATKNEIQKAIKSLYNVMPEKVRVLPNPYKKTMIRGKVGQKGGGKKALVYLAPGDTIAFA
jgi:large subunit ribosomal protein L23